MKFHEEIEQLQAQVKALEDRIEKVEAALPKKKQKATGSEPEGAEGTIDAQACADQVPVDTFVPSDKPVETHESVDQVTADESDAVGFELGPDDVAHLDQNVGDISAAMARDGKRFSGRQAMLAHERKLPPMAGVGGSGKLDPLQMPGQGGGAAGDGGDMGAQDPAQVVAEHGPANEVQITHDHAANKHHVHSTHEDGHSTDSDHGSAEEAHDHGKMLAVSQGGENMGDEADGAEYE